MLRLSGKQIMLVLLMDLVPSRLSINTLSSASNVFFKKIVNLSSWLVILHQPRLYALFNKTICPI